MEDWIFLGCTGKSNDIVWYNVDTTRLIIVSPPDTYGEDFSELYGETPPMDIKYQPYIAYDEEIPISSMVDFLYDNYVEMFNTDAQYDRNMYVDPLDYEIDPASAQNLDWRIIGSVDGAVYFDETDGQCIAHNNPSSPAFTPKPSADCKVYEISSSLNYNDPRSFLEFAGILKSLEVRMGDC